MEENKTNTFDCWCIIELMGHQRIAGKVSEQQLGGTSFIRVDVPPINDAPAFTRLLNHPAVYAINPVSEEVAKRAAENIKAQPITQFEIDAIARERADRFVNSLKEKSPEVKKAIDEYMLQNNITAIEKLGGDDDDDKW